MSTTTLRPKSAIYENGQYYVHGFPSKLGGYSVVSVKKGKFRRSGGTWLNRVNCATYEEASTQFHILCAEIDAIVTEAVTKRETSSATRKQAVADYKVNIPIPWKVGDMCHTSWEYDQTNVDAFQVVEIKSRTQMIVRPIGGHVEDTAYMQGKFTPVQNQFTGAPITVNAGFHFYKFGNSVSESWAVKGHDLYETKPGQSHHFSSYA